MKGSYFILALKNTKKEKTKNKKRKKKKHFNSKRDNTHPHTSQ